MIVRRTTNQTSVSCLECEEDIVLKGEIDWGLRVTCPNCGIELEVINTKPIELDWVYDDDGIEYEYDDDDDDDD